MNDVTTKRKAISKKTRFEVFKRDAFKCQYCGALAPDVVLVVDHIDPVSKGGAHDMMNFITSCEPCNAGKSDRRLDDSTTLEKQKAQLQELSARREQLKMLLSWRDGMRGIDDQMLEAVCDAWEIACPPFYLNEVGRKAAAKYVKAYKLSAVLDAIETARLQYIVIEDGKATAESAGRAWGKVGGILRLSALPDAQRSLYYVKGILRNRVSWIPYDIIKFLELALQDGVDPEAMKAEARHSASWNKFLDWLLVARSDARGE